MFSHTQIHTGFEILRTWKILNYITSRSLCMNVCVCIWVRFFTICNSIWTRQIPAKSDTITFNMMNLFFIYFLNYNPNLFSFKFTRPLVVPDVLLYLRNCLPAFYLNEWDYRHKGTGSTLILGHFTTLWNYYGYRTKNICKYSHSSHWQLLGKMQVCGKHYLYRLLNFHSMS